MNLKKNIKNQHLIQYDDGLAITANQDQSSKEQKKQKHIESFSKQQSQNNSKI